MDEFKEISMEYFETFIIILIIFTVILSIPIILNFIKDRTIKHKK